MAAARRLSELLQEHQEPFLVEVATKVRRPRRGRGGIGGGGLGCCPADACRRLLRLCNHGFKKRKTGGSGGGAGAAFGSGLRSVLSKVLCGRDIRRVLRWEDLGAGCFSGAGSCGGREFRRLRRSLGDSGECDPRAMVFADDDGDEERMGWKADMDVDSSRQLSPVSVLELHSDDDDESPVHSPWEDEKPSTSGSSPPSESFLGGPASPCFSLSYNLHDKFCEMEVDEAEDETGRNNGRSIEEQISSWERIAADISRIPAMMELDLSRSMRQWREMKPEASEIGARIETLIFEDIRSETVCDMLASQCTLAAAATSC